MDKMSSSTIEGYKPKGEFGQDGVYMPEYYYDKDNGRKVTKAGFC